MRGRGDGEEALPTGAADEKLFTCNLCDALCGLRVTLGGERGVRVRGDQDDVFSHGHVCPKAHALGEIYDDPDRLRAPMRRTKAGWERISWDDALGETATRLREVRAKYGNDAVALYVGNPTVHSHRASLGSQALTAALHTKNRFNPNSQDSNPRLFACMQVYGDALSIPVPDIDRTDHLLILGANPAASNGSMMALGDVRTRMQSIRARGGTVTLVDPRRTETMAWATSHHFIRPGGDAALLFSMLNVLFAEGRIDETRVGAISTGLSTLRSLASSFTPDRVGPAIGMEPAAIRTIALDLANARRASVYSRVGTCQADFGPVASWLVEALNVVTGNLEREGGAMFPTPAADIGPLGRLLVGNQWGRWRSRVRGLPEFLDALPSAVMAEEIETPGDGQIRAFVSFAGNPVLSTPNGERLARALPNLDFMVGIDFYINETNRHAHIVLPPMHVFETGNYDLLLARFTVRNMAKYSPPIAEPRDDTRDDWDILSELALRIAGPDIPIVRRMLLRAMKTLPETVIDLLLRTGPFGLSLEKLRAAPHGIDLGPLVSSNGECVRTPHRRVRLAPEAIIADVPRLERWVDERRPEGLVLIGRRHIRNNNSWMHNARSLVKGPDRSRLMMHPSDVVRLGLVDGARVLVKSRAGEITALVAVTGDLMPGVVSLPHGFGHQTVTDTMRVAGALIGPNVNALTDEQCVEPIIGTSILNGVPITVSAIES